MTRSAFDWAIFDGRISTDWISSMSFTTDGKATLSNISYDIREEKLPEHIINSFFEELALCWNSQDDENALSAFNNAKKDAFYCHGRTIPSREVERCSRVITASSFFEHNLDKPKLGLPNTGLRLSKKRIKELVKLNFSKVGKGNMVTNKPYSWVTKSTSLGEVIESSSESRQADLVRTKLGLYNMNKGEHLLEIKYPPEVGKNHIELRLPTFLEAEPCRYFRSKIGNDMWGLTMNLKDYSDGLPEAICPPISFGEGFDVNYIGQVGEVEGGCDDESLLSTFPISWENDLVI